MGACAAFVLGLVMRAPLEMSTSTRIRGLIVARPRRFGSAYGGLDAKLVLD